MSKPPDSNLVELKREDYGQWIGGKTIGTINLSGNHYLIKSGNKIIYRVEKSVKNAEIDCKKILYEYCKNSDKLINEYRYCYHVSGNYLDVKIGDVQIQCDIQDKELIEKYEWFYHMSHKFAYRKFHNNKIKLAEDLLKIPDKKYQIAHKDNNYFNYRRDNLKVTGHQSIKKRNKSK